MKGLHVTMMALVVCGQPCAAQDSASKVSVVLSPVLFAPVSIGVQGGLQVQLSRRWAVLGEAAFLVAPPDERTYVDPSFRRFGLELKRYVGSAIDNKRYLALQTGYLFREFTNNLGDVYRTRDTVFRFDTARIKSPVLATTLKAGTELKISKRFYADVFVGLGLRFVFTEYEAKTSFPTIDNDAEDGFFLLPSYAWLYNYTVTRLHLIAGVKLGLRL